jgi:hypothetical protein
MSRKFECIQPGYTNVSAYRQVKKRVHFTVVDIGDKRALEKWKVERKAYDEKDLEERRAKSRERAIKALIQEPPKPEVVKPCKTPPFFTRAKQAAIKWIAQIWRSAFPD